MKKQLLFVTALFFACINLFAQDEDAPLDRGFYFKVGLNVPSAFYLTWTEAEAEDVKDDGYSFSPGIHLELGNRFYFGSTIADRFRIGLDASWIGLQVNSMKFDDADDFAADDDYSVRVINIQPVKVGPVFSFALNDDMAIDLKYSHGLAIGVVAETYDGEAETEILLGGGILSEIGLAYRFKILSVGLAYQFGALTYSEFDPDEDISAKFNMNAFRVLVGIKL